MAVPVVGAAGAGPMGPDRRPAAGPREAALAAVTRSGDSPCRRCRRFGLIATPPAVLADACAAHLRSRHHPVPTVGLLAVYLGTGVVAAGGAWL
jgi:hypothetical protein